MALPEIDKIIYDIKNDKVSGSSSIANRAAECLDKFAEIVIEQHSRIQPHEYINDLLSVGHRLLTAQPTMAAVLTGVNEVIASVMEINKKLEQEVGTDQEKQLHYLCVKTQAAARKKLIDSKLALESVANLNSDKFEKNDILMTISASSAVERLLLKLSTDGVLVTVYIPESRPMYEGRMLALRLAENGINTILITDSAMFHYLGKCSKIIVGADRVIPKGIINKIGTSGLAIAAKEQGLPFYCVCETSKFVPDIVSLERFNPAQPEVQLHCFCNGDNKPERLKIENIYFDFTPIKYITGFLTDHGLMNKDQVGNYIKQLKILPALLEKID